MASQAFLLPEAGEHTPLASSDEQKSHIIGKASLPRVLADAYGDGLGKSLSILLFSMQFLPEDMAEMDLFNQIWPLLLIAVISMGAFAVVGETQRVYRLAERDVAEVPEQHEDKEHLSGSEFSDDTEKQGGIFLLAPPRILLNSMVEFIDSFWEMTLLAPRGLKFFAIVAAIVGGLSASDLCQIWLNRLTERAGVLDSTSHFGRRFSQRGCEYGRLKFAP